VDDLPVIVSWVSTIALAIALAATAGLRAWLPLFVAGLLARLGVAEVGAGFAWIASTPAIVLFGVATVLEIVGDKVPALDHALDSVGTVIRPLAGAIVAAAVLVRIEDPLIASVVGLLVGAPTALAPHAAKAGARAVSSATTFGFANPVLSAIEDGLAITFALLAFVVPVLAVLALLLVLWAAWRWVRRARSGQVGRGRGRA
jgi:hypothetical protein